MPKIETDMVKPKHLKCDMLTKFTNSYKSVSF